MNTKITIHPKLHHYGLATADIDGMVEWYRKVLGMTVNHALEDSGDSAHHWSRPPFSGFAFMSNDEMDHRIVLFEIP